MMFVCLFVCLFAYITVFVLHSMGRNAACYVVVREFTL